MAMTELFIDAQLLGGTADECMDEAATRAAARAAAQRKQPTLSMAIPEAMTELYIHTQLIGEAADECEDECKDGTGRGDQA